MTPLLVPLPGTDHLAVPIAKQLDIEAASMSFHRFPDDEAYVRFLTSPKDRDVILLACLDRPDPKLMQLFFTAAGARELGAKRVGLVAPYLPYMRQDKRFKPGEVITSTAFAKQVSTLIDWLITIDPHLHRWTSLDQIYSIPTHVLHAEEILADWIKQHVKNPFLIGPDSESEQWVSQVARRIGCEHIVMSKTRRDDRDVSIKAPDLATWKTKTPVIVDDTISSGRTMAETVKIVLAQGLPAPLCCAVHGVYTAAAFSALTKTGPAKIATTNTVPCETAAIDVSELLAQALQAHALP